jgi:PIN domain nuclease of toxin-antitoxin system
MSIFLRKIDSAVAVPVYTISENAIDLTAIMKSALTEKWTRDPFDRWIAAHAKAKGFVPLISADKKIQENYPRAVW